MSPCITSLGSSYTRDIVTQSSRWPARPATPSRPSSASLDAWPLLGCRLATCLQSKWRNIGIPSSCVLLGSCSSRFELLCARGRSKSSHASMTSWPQPGRTHNWAGSGLSSFVLRSGSHRTCSLSCACSPQGITKPVCMPHPALRMQRCWVCCRPRVATADSTHPEHLHVCVLHQVAAASHATKQTQSTQEIARTRSPPEAHKNQRKEQMSTNSTARRCAPSPDTRADHPPTRTHRNCPHTRARQRQTPASTRCPHMHGANVTHVHGAKATPHAPA
jgi:hypothetical protein